MTSVSTRFDVTDPDQRSAGLAAAGEAIRNGSLVVLPTDTVYGVAADAFDPAAVQALLDAKGRGRQMPPPVLVSAATTLDALAVRVPAWARALVEAYWPGPLTLVCHQQSSLQWDLGETHGTVAVRMPSDEVALELLSRTGPLAVTSANLTGQPAATDAGAAQDMLGASVAVYLDAGPTHSDVASTIVDCTTETPRLLREGVIGRAELRTFLAGHEVTLSEPDATPGPPGA